MTTLSFENPFRAAGTWWRGNLHTHTNRSDGELPPEETAERYRELGYDFLAITDHRLIAEPFDAPEGLLVIPGVEYGLLSGEPPRAWHVVSLGTTEPIATDDVDPVRLYSAVSERSAFCWLAHPYWSNLSEDDLFALAGVTTMEVYNAVCERCIDRGCSESAWDYALAAGVRMNAIAVDDAHATCDVGRAWIMLRAEKLDANAVYDALRRGLYYSSGGPEIHDLTVEGNVVRVRTSPCKSISFLAKSARGAFTSAPDGETLDAAEYEIAGDEIYVRVQVECPDGRRAYTNPIYVENTHEET